MPVCEKCGKKVSENGAYMIEIKFFFDTKECQKAFAKKILKIK